MPRPQVRSYSINSYNHPIPYSFNDWCGGNFLFQSSKPNLVKTIIGSGRIHPWAVFLRFFIVAFLHFLTPAGGSNLAGQSLTFNEPNLTLNNLSKATVKIRRNPAPGFYTLVPIIVIEKKKISLKLVIKSAYWNYLFLETGKGERDVEICVWELKIKILCSEFWFTQCLSKV